MAINGTPRTYYHKWKFIIEIEGIAWAGFKTCSAIEMEAATVAISEGGSVIPRKSPGRITVSKVTLERGATADNDLYSWWLEVANVAANGGEPDDAYKRDVDIVQQDRNGDELQRWRLFRAWPTKYMAGDFDNESDEFRIESVELDLDYPEPVAA